MTKISVLAVAIFAAIAAPPARADAFYLGPWRVASAVVAPWADTSRPLSTAEKDSLVGKTVTFRAAGIDGPKQLACRNLKYKLVDSGPDMLFQGELAEPREGKPPSDPAAAAAALGFKGTSWKTLETGCGNELDFHFLDEKTAEFGLNDYVYRMEKQ
ncbi:MAG TPA: hypothetical protein VLX67_04140 [Stellaceae bacterium]|nr:hypothetical protein [Stellaceae bacterium]